LLGLFIDQTDRDRRHYFPERNATTAALSEVTVIVEAGDRSGTLVHGRHALAQGRWRRRV
jgi:DNA processing protein